MDDEAHDEQHQQHGDEASPDSETSRGFSSTSAGLNDEAVLVAAPDVFRVARESTAACAVVFGHVERAQLFLQRGHTTMRDYAFTELGIASVGQYKKVQAAANAVWKHYPSDAENILRSIIAGYARNPTLPTLPDLTSLARLEAAVKATPEPDRAALVEQVARGELSTRDLERIARAPRDTGANNDGASNGAPDADLDADPTEPASGFTSNALEAFESGMERPIGAPLAALNQLDDVMEVVASSLAGVANLDTEVVKQAHATELQFTAMAALKQASLAVAALRDALGGEPPSSDRNTVTPTEGGTPARRDWASEITTHGHGGAIVRALVNEHTDLDALATGLAADRDMDPDLVRSKLQELLAQPPLIVREEHRLPNPLSPKGWNGAPFPRKAERVVLPDGRPLEDALIWPDFCQDELGLDPNELWQELMALPTWPNDQPIPYRERGDDPHWISGDHAALRYRGHPVKRSKIWLQSDYATGLRRYGYTGWQHRISLATHAVESVPAVQRIAARINERLIRSGHTPHTHWIVTRYTEKENNIGLHADKDDDFAANTFFIVVKFGAPRPFAFRLRGERKPFLTRTLSAGTAVFVRCAAPDAANNLIQHGVPPMTTPVGVSGSLVGRAIETIIPWDHVRLEVEKRERKAGGASSTRRK